MSDSDNGEFDEKLMELNNWQIEQENKLKLFEEVQKKLLDLEHQKVVASLEAHYNDQMQAKNENDPQSSAMVKMNIFNKQSETSTKNQVFSYESDAIKLKDPKVSLCSFPESSEKSDEFVSDKEEYESETVKPRRFLKRGSGLARFNMTSDDFKTPPNIYREKKIKTYLSQKPEFNNKRQQKKGKGPNDGVKRKSIPACKSKSVPVNIYLTESKSKKAPTKNVCESKVTKMPCTKNKELHAAKTPIRNLTLKPVPHFNYMRDLSNEKKTDGSGDKQTEESSIEKELQKDEKELEMFELLEGKIGDGSISPNSSLMAKFMEQSVCSTPFKPLEETSKPGSSRYSEKYLSSEHIDKLNESDEELFSIESSNSGNAQRNCQMSEDCHNHLGIIDENKISKILERELRNFKLYNKNDEKESCMALQEESSYGETQALMSKKASQTLEEDIGKITKREIDVQDDCQIDKDNIDKAKHEENIVDINDQVFSQREMAIKLQRKALQDNVKTLLNWEGAKKKKKKSSKKAKDIPVKPENSKVDEENDLDKIFVNNELIKERMAEIEKELEIFQRENKALSQTKKEFEMEKAKLEKDRKDFEKYMEQEKEKFESHIKEERAKFQKEKSVFEKHTKQLKNQPNKKEREEIANLKKEIRQLTLTMSTKEGRFKALRVSLSSQIKRYVLENMELKSELEKLKKENTVNVMPRNRRNVQTRTINAINNELGRLRPHLFIPKTSKYTSQSRTVRVDNNLREPMRRVNSDPNMNNLTEKNDDVKENNMKNQSDKSSDVEDNARALPEKNQTENKSHDTTGTTLPSGPTLEEITNSIKSPPAIRNEFLDGEFDDDSDFGSPKMLLESMLRENDFELGNFEQRTEWVDRVSQLKKRLKNIGLFRNITDRLPENDEESSDESDSESNIFRNLLPGEGPYKETWKESILRQPKCRPDCDLCVADTIQKRVREDGVRETLYPNGNVKIVSADKRFVKILYYNGDSKLTDRANGKVKYHYAGTDTWHTTFRSGLEILEFPNKQVEKLFPNGATKITFPNGCIRYCDPNGKENWKFPDGTSVRTDENGDKVLLLRNGLKEIHTNEYKRREYPNGTVKIVYVDGLQETIYASGRIVWKDIDGSVLRDTAKM